MRKTISDAIIEIASKHENLNERIEIYGKMMVYYIEGIVVDERMRKYLEKGAKISEKLKGNQNRCGTTEKTTVAELKNKCGRVEKNNCGTTEKPKAKPKKSDITESDLTIYISNNKGLYDIVCKYIDVDNGNIQYIINNNYNKSYNKYIYSQMLEAEKVIKQIGTDKFNDLLNYIKQDDFWNKQILTIAKLNRKNKEGVPYWVVIQDKMKPHTIKNQERELQIQRHRQQIREQIESFKSENKQNEQTGLQNGGYNRRENIRLSDIPG